MPGMKIRNCLNNSFDIFRWRHCLTVPLFFLLCSQYGEVTLTCVFLQELTPPLHPAPGTTRSDVTLARECQRLGGGKLFFGGMFDCSFPFFRE